MAENPLLELIALGRLAGGTLSLPSRIEQATQQQGLSRDMLTQAAAADPSLGLTPEKIEQYAPSVGMQYLNPSAIAAKDFPGSGTVGKIVGGVGDVGQIISALFGGPIGAPRVPLSDLTALSKLRAGAAERGAREDLVGSLTNEQAKAAARVGAYGPALTHERGPKPSVSELGMEERIRNEPDPEKKKVLIDALASYRAGLAARSRESASAMGGVFNERERLKSDIRVQERVKNAANTKLGQFQEVENTVYPLMDMAIPALTSNPAYAKTAQPIALWLKTALGADRGAAAARALANTNTMLARTVDVGALTGQEQAVWDKFVKAQDMTGTELATMGTILRTLFTQRKKVWKSALQTGQMPADEYVPLHFGGEEPGAAGDAGDDAEMESLFEKYSK